MSTTTAEETYTAEPADDQALEYRALHTGAIAGLVLGVISVFTLVTAPTSLEWCLSVCPIPLVGIFISLRAWSQISRQSDMYTGSTVAAVGLVLSTFFLVTGVGYATYVYTTEVPDGYTRISFAMMKPDEVDQRGGKVIPDEIAALDGKPIFLKGFIRPDSLKVRKKAKQFLLVRDSNTCCFGDLSKVAYFDQVMVAMQDGLSVDYTTGIFRMGGVLRMQPENLARGPSWPVFMLEADYAK
jgi:hypothetical protein